ncbi:MAG TPA: respiratory nitrate reductase subunit gamma [Actinocatenispora sp.]
MVVVLVGGTVWRYRYDQFGWTTRSSELYESRLLRFGSPLFHFGLVFVVLGHLMGLVVPERFTDWLGLSEAGYHAMALALGGVAGIATLAGIVILVWRRRTTGPVFMATTRNDKLMYVVLVAAILAGLWVTLVFNAIERAHTGGYNYRASVAPWFRSLFAFQPDVSRMAGAPVDYQVHTVIGMVLFMLWPFTRLVHAFTAPVGYLFRPYLVYRSRDGRRARGDRGTGRAWSPVGTSDRTR